MQYFFKIFFLIFLFVSKTIFAKDISDFKIENISIGESLLKYTSKKNIYNQYDYSVQDYNYLREPNKYLEIYIDNKKFKEFDKVSVFIKNSSSRYLSEKNDNYNILSIRGMIKTLDYQNCLKKKNEIDRDLSYLFPNLDTNENKTIHPIDQSGKSFYDEKIYHFKNGSRITLTCIIFEDDFKKKNKYFDSFSLNLVPKEIIVWLNEY